MYHAPGGMSSIPQRLRAVLLLLLAAVTPLPATEPPIVDVGPPLILQLDGVVARSRAAAREGGLLAASFGWLGGAPGETLWLGVDAARTTGGDHHLDGKDVLNAVAPFTPNLLVTGPPDLVAKLRDASPGTRLHVEGLVDRGARTYLLRRVVVRG